MKRITFVFICILSLNRLFAQETHSPDSIFYLKALGFLLDDYENDKELFLIDTLFDRILCVPPVISFFEDSMDYYSTKECWWNNMLSSCTEPARPPEKVTYFSSMHTNDTLIAKYILCFYQTFECGNLLRLDAEVLPINIKINRHGKRKKVFWYMENSRFTTAERHTFWFDVRDNSIYKYSKGKIIYE